MALAMSHPTWVRGLKLPYLVRGAKIYVVAPYVGAWIETLSIVMIRFVILSHPTWVRGLKPSVLECSLLTSSSHPTWVRGLKPKNSAI